MNSSARIRNVAFSLATVFSLGFGMAHAFASPGTGADTARACSWTYCDYDCRARGYSFGMCEEEFGTVNCVCYG